MDWQSVLGFLGHWWWIGAILLFSILNAVLQKLLTPRQSCFTYAALTTAFFGWIHAPIWAWIVGAVWFVICGLELVLSDFLAELRKMHEEQFAKLRDIDTLLSKDSPWWQSVKQEVANRSAQQR